MTAEHLPAHVHSVDEPVPFELVRPRTAAEAASMLASPGSAALGGGTELLLELRRRTRTPRIVVDLSGVGELAGIRTERMVVRVGSTVRLAEAARAESLRTPDLLAFAAASASVGVPQVRAQGTVGGNLLQLPRCLYLWRGHACQRNGGVGCPARETGLGLPGRIVPMSEGCLAPLGSDLAAVAVLLEATVEVEGAEGSHRVRADVFFRERSEAPSSQVLIVSLLLPRHRWDRTTYVKGVQTNASFLDGLGVAVGLRVARGRCLEVRIVVAGADHPPWEIPGLNEALVGLPVRDLAGAVDDAVPAYAGTSKARRGLLVSLVRQALEGVVDE